MSLYQLPNKEMCINTLSYTAQRGAQAVLEGAVAAPSGAIAARQQHDGAQEPVFSPNKQAPTGKQVSYAST